MANDEVIEIRCVLASEAIYQLTQCGSLHTELLAEFSVRDLQFVGEVRQGAKGSVDGVHFLLGGEAPLNVEQLDHGIELLKL